MTMKRIDAVPRIVVLLLTVWLTASGMCGERRITLGETIALARERSVDAEVAANSLRSAYWEYRTYRAKLLPEITFSGTIPSYNKRYNSWQNSDGSYTFLRDDNLKLEGSLNVEQRIWLTGGTLSLASSLDFIRQLSGETGNLYMSVPVALRLNQPLFGVNDVKWDRRIEPVRYREAKATYIMATEEVALTAIRYFFTLLTARETLANAAQNVANAEKMYDAAKVQREMGRISGNDLLQIELNLINSRSEYLNGESEVKSAMFQLRSFLDLPETEELVPVPPANGGAGNVEYDNALQLALANNPLALNIRRRQLEADYEVAKAKGDMRQINLFAQVGFTGTDNNLSATYRNLRDNQIIEVGVSIPLLDWGKRKGKVETARSRQMLTESTLRKERSDFCQNLFVLVERFNNQQSQLGMAIRADEIATRRYDSSVETFMIGKLSALDLNNSQENKDSAKLKYLNELYMYWYYYYQLRSLTLWDFEEGLPIEADFDHVISGK